MVAVVCVRSVVDLPSSLEAITACLRSRRLRGEHTQDERIDGIWVCGEPGAWPGRYEADASRGGAGDSHAGTDVALALWESCELSGVWSCVWLEGAPVSAATGTAGRQDAILRLLTTTSSPSGVAGGLFLPVFDADEPESSLAVAVDALRARYPQVVGSGWLRHDRTRGLVGAAVQDVQDVAR